MPRPRPHHDRKRSHVDPFASRSTHAAPPLRGATADDPAVRAIQRRTLAVVITSQVFGGAGLAAGVTVGGLIAEDMLGSEGVAGLPSGVFTLGSAVAAFSIGRYSQRAGRRLGLAAGFLAGAAGAVGIVAAAVIENPVLLFASLLVYGSGTATNLQARYAGTDLATPATRATAAAAAMVATTFGAVAGPNLVGPLGELAGAVGVPRLAGPFLLAAVAYGAAGLCLLVLLRPDPLHVARTLAVEPSAPTSEQAVPGGAPRRRGIAPGVVVGATVMVLTQCTMTAIMTMTPIHMRHHDHGLQAVGLVISLHIAAMYLPSLLTGRLVDRVGRLPMAAAAGATLLAAGIVAAAAPPTSMTWLTVALVLLGLGWNFGLLAGTTLIVDATTWHDRARTQGTVDVLIALAGATGGAASGLVVRLTGFPTLALGGGMLALALVPVVLWYAAGRRAATRPDRGGAPSAGTG
ncbi:MFS transporter [Nocardioides sp. L-11A]|uniref:MFS transporter n=1 Tax=Nocardioides sp. L-11A TaxID=3043848 RepID=UPI00249B9E71|nr:MFS transporter [Nocardioides sp. L-11A]